MKIPDFSKVNFSQVKEQSVKILEGINTLIKDQQGLVPSEHADLLNQMDACFEKSYALIQEQHQCLSSMKKIMESLKASIKLAQESASSQAHSQSCDSNDSVNSMDSTKINSEENAMNTDQVNKANFDKKED